MKSGVWQNDDMLANVCKHNVTRFPYQIGRFAQDIAGGLMVTLPSEAEFRSPETGPLLKKYLKGKKGCWRWKQDENFTFDWKHDHG